MNNQKKHTGIKRKPAAFKTFSISLFVLTAFLMGGCGNKESENASSTDGKSSLDQSANAKIGEEQKTASDDSGIVVTPKATSEDWNLILVNRDHQLDGELGMELYLTDSGYQIDSRIKEAYLGLIEAGHAAGMDFTLVSGYRSIEAQQANYDTTYNNNIAQGYTPEEAKAKTEEFIALPNASEHTTGLSIDITSTQLANEVGGSGLFQELENYPEGEWLKENAPTYGFVLRYPKEKEDITKIAFEPWHFRYVGVENALYMTENDLTLEEYVAILQNNEKILAAQ